MTTVLFSSAGSLVKSVLKKRVPEEDWRPNGGLQGKASSLERLSAFRVEPNPSLSHSNHELGLEFSQMRRRGGIAVSAPSGRGREAHTTSTPCLQTINENIITVSIQRRGLLLLHNIIKPPGHAPIHTQLQPLLEQLDVKDPFKCSVMLRNMEEEEEEVLDLTQMSKNYFGHHIIVDISSCMPYVASEDGDHGDDEEEEEMNGWHVSSVQQCLNHFDDHGISPLPGSQTPAADSFASQVELPELPSSWRLVVAPDELERLDAAGGKAEDLQQYIWELVQTEHSHIQQLQTVVNVFMQALEYIMAVDILTEVNYNNIFGSMRDILSAHEDFWSNVLLPCWLRMRLRRQLFDLDELLSQFPKFSVQFEIYEQHCIFETENMRALNEAVNKPDFKAYLEWCEARPECQRLRLKDYLAKPMQRLTKYVLLLRQITKSTEEPHQMEKMESIMNEVNSFVSMVNGTLQNQEDVDKVKDVMSQIDGYSAVTGSGEMERVLHPYTHLDLLAPIPGVHLGYPRTLFHRDVMRYKDSEGKDTCNVFVFTDLLLIAKAFKRGGECKLDVIVPPCRIDRVVMRVKDNVSFYLVILNDFGLATTAFSLRAENVQKARAFQAQVDEAQLCYEHLVEESCLVAKRRSTVSPGMYTGSISELVDTADREKWTATAGHRQVATPTSDRRSLTPRMSAQGILNRLATPDHSLRRSVVMSVTSEGSGPTAKSPVSGPEEQQVLGSPDSDDRTDVRICSSAPLLIVTQEDDDEGGEEEEEEEELILGVDMVTDPNERKALYVSMVPLNSKSAGQNGRHTYIGTEEMGIMEGEEEAQGYGMKRLSVELHRVDTIRSTTECALVSFSDIHSQSSDSADPTKQSEVDTHSVGSSSLDLTVVTSGSDGVREELCETTETDSRLSSAVGGNEPQPTVEPTAAVNGQADKQQKGRLFGKAKQHRFSSSDGLDGDPFSNSSTVSNPLKRLFNFHPLWRRSKAKSLPGYHLDDKKSPKGTAKKVTRSNRKAKSDMDSPIGREAVDTIVIIHGPTWV